MYGGSQRQSICIDPKEYNLRLGRFTLNSRRLTLANDIIHKQRQIEYHLICLWISYMFTLNVVFTSLVNFEQKILYNANCFLFCLWYIFYPHRVLHKMSSLYIKKLLADILVLYSEIQLCKKKSYKVPSVEQVRFLYLSDVIFLHIYSLKFGG